MSALDNHAAAVDDVLDVLEDAAQTFAKIRRVADRDKAEACQTRLRTALGLSSADVDPFAALHRAILGAYAPLIADDDEEVDSDSDSDEDDEDPGDDPDEEGEE